MSRRATGRDAVDVSFPDGRSFAPVRIAVEVRDPVVVDVGRGPAREVAVKARAEAELAAGLGAGPVGFATGGGYNGPLAYRQGKPMRPDVALAFDRMYAAARAAGVTLIVNSAYRSDAEQARAVRGEPGPEVGRAAGPVAAPARDRARPRPAAARWLDARRTAGASASSSGTAGSPGTGATRGQRGHGVGRLRRRGRVDGDDGRASAIPSFVPARFAPMLSRAAQRYNVSARAARRADLRRVELQPERRQRPAGAQGIAQFMPGTAPSYGLRNPFDPEQAIDAQARMMRDLLRRFASVPLALAAYNAGPGRVAACMCIPPIPETRGYVARILGLLGGAGDASGLIGLEVRLVK